MSFVSYVIKAKTIASNGGNKVKYWYFSTLGLGSSPKAKNDKQTNNNKNNRDFFMNPPKIFLK